MEHIEDGIYSEMTVYVDIESSVKFTKIKIRNQSGKSRKLSATGYIEWVLGNNRMKTSMYIHSEIDPESGALFGKNPYNTEFSDRVAFFDVDNFKKTVTTDRNEFIGRNRTLKNPEAMSKQKLSGRTGLALDPCAAIQVPFELQDGEEHEITFRLGAGKNAENTSQLVRQYRGATIALESLEKVKNYWSHTIGAIQIETPDAALNILTNGWLTYQTISSRLWGRSGYYQSGGAFGYRDQLQDVLSILHTEPEISKEQILRCASHQFLEGDVQHWWHPPVGRGVRTLCSDDYLWLPYVTSLYIQTTGDSLILNESCNYIEGRQLNKGEESYYDLPIKSKKQDTLYKHCFLAIRHGLKFGKHGLPLIGSGDWNDGFDKVGTEGLGESVWMGFFLYQILIQFSKNATAQNDLLFAEECIAQAKKLKENINKNAWDGQWYKRAWFDDGTALGSSINKECRIDSISQSWSILSDGGDLERSKTGLESAYKNLVQKESKIIQLLEPPFDNSDLNPGYIKGYVPGVRENGGQYTHAAIWMITAFAKLGDNRKVWELLEMINPLNHGKTPEEIAIYKVEPYVLAADVYAREPHIGRGGWTWYTGSASWMYKLITESFLGLQRTYNHLTITPCIPSEWEFFKMRYRFKNTYYSIHVIQKNGFGETTFLLDNNEAFSGSIPLIDDGIQHTIEILIYRK